MAPSGASWTGMPTLALRQRFEVAAQCLVKKKVEPALKRFTLEIKERVRSTELLPSHGGFCYAHESFERGP